MTTKKMTDSTHILDLMERARLEGEKDGRREAIEEFEIIVNDAISEDLFDLPLKDYFKEAIKKLKQKEAQTP